jgi:hypothetical protein
MRRAGAVAVGAITAALLASAPAGAAPTWLAPTDISPSGEEGFGPGVASAPGGGAIAVWTAAEGEGQAVRASIRPPGGPWGAPVSISAPGSESYAPTPTIDAAGDATVVWEAETSGGTKLEAASLLAGGAWGPPRVIGSVGEAVEEPPALAADATGAVTVVWERVAGAKATVETASHPVGGGWSPPRALSVAGEEALEARIAVDARGDAAAVWKDGGAEETVESAQRPAGGDWAAPTRVTAAGEEGVFPQVGLDAVGDATVVWERTDATNFVVREADRPAAGAWSTPRRISPGGFDAFAPRLAVDPGGDAIAAWPSGSPPAKSWPGSRAVPARRPGASRPRSRRPAAR